MEWQGVTIKKLNKDLSKLLYQLFVTNTYAMAVQMKDGRYVTKYLPISEYLVEEMLNYKGSIGCYQQCYKSNMVRWICFDFDCREKANPDIDYLFTNNVKPLLQLCDELGIRYLTEFSGRRGIHVWIIFSHLIPKEKAYQILSHLHNQLLYRIGELKNANLDLFPATNSSKGNVVGKQVKMPLSCHKSGKRSWLFEGQFKLQEWNNQILFLENQYQILKKYKVNDYEKVCEKIGLKEDDFIVRLKYNKYLVENDLKLSIWNTIQILSETEVYRQLFERLMQGKAFRQDWLVVLGTFSQLNDGGKFVKELFSIFPNYDVEKTMENISRYKDRYFPATFEYLYRIYNIEIEDFIDKDDTGFSYLLKKNGITPKVQDASLLYKPKNERQIMVEDTIRKEKRYILDNDEVLNVDIWNSLNSFKLKDITYIQNTVDGILARKEEPIKWIPKAKLYYRKENEEKLRPLVSLCAFDRVLTTQVVLLLQNKLKKLWNSFSYNVSFSSRDDIFYNWYSSWGEYINRIKTFLEVPFMENYEVFVIDLKEFYDHIDFLSVYSIFSDELDEDETNLFKFLIDYNDMLMRSLFNGRRKGVPQGPAYARIISEMYLDNIVSTFFREYDNTIYHLYRYVDDIIVFVEPENNSNEIYTRLVNKLISYGLPINEGKSFWYGSIKSCNEAQKRKILRKDKFTYDLQNTDYKGYVTLIERNKDINQYLTANEFEIGDVSLFFGKRAYVEASGQFFLHYALDIMRSEIGRGSAFKRFYDYLFTHPDATEFALEQRYFSNIPLDSINFGNFIGELYLMVQEKSVDQEVFYRIQKEYLQDIPKDKLSDEYKIVVNSLIKIRYKVEEEC